MKTTQVQLASTPEGTPTEDNFSLVEVELPSLGESEVLCETQYLSLDPYMRSQISGRHLSGAVNPGQGMSGETIARVLESRSEAFAEGDLVRVMGGWQTHSIHAATEVAPVPSGDVPASYFLSALGMPGLTAYAGLIWQAKPQAGETVLIPAATGGVGAVAGQLAKSHGCRVIGIAGGAEKCRIATEELGYDACIDRLAGDVGEQLDALSPDGVDVFFDLVGGELLHQVSQRLKVGARVILCGMIAEYNAKERMPGPPPALWIIARATVYGLVVYDFESRRQEFVDAVAPLIDAGTLLVPEDMVEGLANAPALFCRLMRGENRGKAVVKVA
ncbi:NADP-dependent oxidoreductase [Halioglobus maricola]|uniref:NADP-dependent oxidoreductase n=1 Tax=Halioglobus maricola TaxID=2601894 RepID=A0A5P9NKS8_9GAMM|nr:NADP-dependent oxidoreductase [Halioglobus maricola]QFU75558.1 NADP-dependent oxidoreductase [Halioglobus maricola]